MVDIAGGVLKGFEYGRSLGLQEQEMARQREEMRQQSERKQRLAGLIQSYSGGNKGVLPQMLAYGEEGQKAAGFLAGQEKQGLAQQKQSLDQAAMQYKTAFANMMGMPEEGKPEARQALIAHAARTGLIPKDMANQISYFADSDPEKFDESMSQYFGLAEKPKQSSFAADLKAVGIEPNSDLGRQMLAQKMSGKSQKITIDPSTGEITIAEGAAADSPAMQKPVITQMQKNVLEQTESLERMQATVDSFNPEWLKVPERLGLAWSGLKEKFTDLDDAEQQSLQQFSQFKAQALDNFNAYIKSITGAAMTQSEAERIQKAFPSVGEGIFDGDSPTVFKSKLAQVMNTLKVIRARSQYALKNAAKWDEISLDNMKSILRQEQDRFYQEAGWSDDLSNEEKARVVAEVKARLRDEYGF